MTDETEKPKPTRAEARLMRSAARLAAAESEFETGWNGAEIEGAQYREADVDLFRALLRGAVENQSRIDRLTNDALVERWPLGRVDATLRALFRAAGAEILRGETPPKVVISEFVDVAKAFFDDGREAKFVNAVLDHVARAARPEAFAAG
jgi:N utilization substance protein B